MKVFGYVRVSTIEQAKGGDSLETQRQQITGYAMMKGWRLAEVFVEGGVSGSVPLADRPEGQRLLRAAGKGDVIITARLDRAFRSASDALGTLEELKALGVGLHMIDLGGDVCGNGISKLVFTILSAVAESERDRIRERIRDVKRHLASQGIYGGGKRPFGFDVLDGRLVRNKHEQAAVERMTGLRREGRSFREISATVASEFQCTMTPMTVRRILLRGTESCATVDENQGRTVMTNPWKFLDGWADENVHATIFDDKATAEQLAHQCRQEAKDAGVSEASIIKAANGNLESFMLDRLNRAVNAEVDRLVAKDKS